MEELPADRLKTARLAAGHRSAKEAARRFGWSENSYPQYENGTRGISPGRARQFGKAYKVSASWLLTGTGPGPGEQAEAIEYLTEAYRRLPPEYRKRLLESAETHLRAAGADQLRRPNGEDEKDPSKG